MKTSSFVRGARSWSCTLPLLTLLSGALALPSLAFAQASPKGAAAINAKFTEIAAGVDLGAGLALDTCLMQEYYATELSGGPQRTPDGGAFEFWKGRDGLGAIYWAPDTAHAVRIFGKILSTWADWGYEKGLGYPVSDQPFNGYMTYDGYGSPRSCVPDVDVQDDMIFIPNSVIDILYDSNVNKKPHVVHGDIWQSWFSSGSRAHGTGEGWPVSDEFTVTNQQANNIEARGFYCPEGFQQQNFYNPTTRADNKACWNPATREVTWSTLVLPYPEGDDDDESALDEVASGGDPQD